MTSFSCLRNTMSRQNLTSYPRTVTPTTSSYLHAGGDPGGGQQAKGDHTDHGGVQLQLRADGDIRRKNLFIFYLQNLSM